MSDKQTAPILPPPLSGGGGNNGGSTGGALQQQTVSLQQVLAAAQGLNVLTTGSGSQFVITSQVPGLTQVIPGHGTTNASLQSVGVTRIVNIPNAASRVNVVGVAGASGSLTSPTRHTPTKLVLATSPKLVRTSIGNVFVTPTSQASLQSPSAKKRLKLTESTEKSTLINDDSMGYKRRIIEHKMKRMRAIRDKYVDNASELFFLLAGGNMMDFQTWRKKPSTTQYLHFLRQHRLDPEDDDEDLTVPLPMVTEITSSPTTVTCSPTIVPLNQGTEVKISGIGVTPVAVSTTLPAAVAQLSQQGQIPGRPQGGRHGMVFAIRAAIQSSSVTVHPTPTSTITPTLIIVPDSSKLVTSTTIATSFSIAKPSLSCTSSTSTITTSVKTPTLSLINPQPIVKLIKLPPTPSVSSTSEAVSNQEQIVEKAKQEAYVMQRIAELQRDGLWSERRLPKVQEPSRVKAHWDYLLEEMVWLAADFAQERKWKKAAAKKCARMVQKHFQEKAIQAQKAEKSQELRLKKIAGFVAKEIKMFWTNVEKLVEYKQQTRLEEKRKKALDQHLNFIVGQTEKYSTWLTEGLNKADGSQSIPPSINSSRISSPIPSGKYHSDEEFQPNQSSDDDEETIAKAEEEMKSTTNHKEEVELLKRESEIPLEDLLKDLPPDYLEDRTKNLSPDSKESADEDDEKNFDKDDDFIVLSEPSSDEEDTIVEQEKLEGNQDHKVELDQLKADNDLSIEELMIKYGHMSDSSINADKTLPTSDKESVKGEDQDDEITSDESETEESDDEEMQEENSQTQSDNDADVGLKSLLEDPSNEKKSMEVDQSNDHHEMDDVAALAESIQPKGNTLLTTSVVTKIPFLLKHSLREYQHIGLDWLVTMYERKLNGILADEMGLGKTIQTIALLAHLACEKGNWGPHLIIVPTSVMLNWEMECKKWCPGFKILTYYGTQKERKQKRTGWTKPNAFHICITSYKLVIQDHQSFRRKKWKYLILDEAQNIKNFKSQRWQLLLNFQTQRRLLLTGTPLQNNLMELWSLMHFLMPNVFQSHKEFKEWFSNPVTGMIEGNSEYNENIIRRLHKVLRPFLLRRLKTEVEKQLPKKYEHIIMCRLSKRQRYLYDDFMSRAMTKETLVSGNLLSVINVLMQLRKVCNHPNLFEVRPTVSPFQMEAIDFVTASLAWSALDYDPFKHIDLSCLNLSLVDMELMLTAFVAHRVRRLKTPKKFIEEVDYQPELSPRCPPGKIKINVRLSNQVKQPPPQPQTPTKLKNLTGILPNPRVGTSPLIKTLNNQNNTPQGVTLRVAGGQQLQGYSVQLVQHQGSVKAIPVATLSHNPQSTTVTSTTAAINAQRITVGSTNIRDGLQRLATQTVTVKQGDSVQRIAVPSFAQLVQTSTGRHIILTSTPQSTNTVSFPVMTPSGQRLTVVSKPLMGISTSATTVNKVLGSVVTTASGTSGRPVMRVPPLNVNTTPTQSNFSTGGLQSQQTTLRCGVLTRSTLKDSDKPLNKENPKSEFHLPQVEEERRQRRRNKLNLLSNVNERRCAACPLYGEDLFTALRIGKPSMACPWHASWMHCETSKYRTTSTRRQFFSRTEALAEAIKNTERIVEEFKAIFERFVVYVPAVRAPVPRFHVSRPPPHKLWGLRRIEIELTQQLSPKLALFHPIANAMMTQFPDARLIQYDCGKLQSLDRLLRQLKSGSHRVLIFTQMTRMLDVLEAFLNFHGHIYLRLDGATKVDQRQILMERFNGDKRIFCFILSTRSGGVGVNLTGADTVIFYDSDWNPTMDAQAQDRCHRIGQTRDVHIYRLVSEKTVEENILKKANQKRLLGDLAIEGGNFTTAYFKSSTIQDLFNVDQSENDASTRMMEVLEHSRDREKHLPKDYTNSTSGQPHVEEKVAIGALENALAAAEEDLDVQAAKTAKAEAVADLAEFDENIPLDDVDGENPQISKAEQEFQNLVSQLTPIERYAMKFIEDSEGVFSAAQLAAAERELEEQKKEWEMDRLRALREEEERRMRMADDDDERPLTFAREDAQNQVNSNSNSNNKKLNDSKKVQPSRRSLRKFNVSNDKNAEKSSESESETTTDSESESQEDVVEDSPDEESSFTESQSQGDEDEEEREGEEEEEEEEEEDGEEDEGGNDRDGTEEKDGYQRRRNRSSRSFDQNHFDLNSPRTRSRGNVKINLWTLDVSPILPSVKCRGRYTNRRKKSENSETEESNCSKKTINSSFTLLVDKTDKEQNNIENNEELVLSRKILDVSDNIDRSIVENSLETDEKQTEVILRSTSPSSTEETKESSPIVLRRKRNANSRSSNKIEPEIIAIPDDTISNEIQETHSSQNHCSNESCDSPELTNDDTKTRNVTISRVTTRRSKSISQKLFDVGNSDEVGCKNSNVDQGRVTRSGNLDTGRITRTSKKIIDDVNGLDSLFLQPGKTTTKLKSNVLSSSPNEVSRTILKRRPDTPFPEDNKTRPITRSASSTNNSSIATRSSINNIENIKAQLLENGFAYPIVSIRKRSFSKQISENETSNNNTWNKLKSNTTTILRRRPDTPMPTIDSLPRVTRSGTKTCSTLNNHNNCNENGNVQDELNSYTNEKPQRTAKVVAILTLDSHSKHNSKPSSSSEDLNHDTEPTFIDKKLNKRRNKRTRNKSSIVDKSDETETIDSLNEEEQIQPVKKSLRTQTPPSLTSSSKIQSDKTSSSS